MRSRISLIDSPSPRREALRPCLRQKAVSCVLIEVMEFAMSFAAGS